MPTATAIPATEERWGDFVLTPNPPAHATPEHAAPRKNFPFEEGESRWNHRFAIHHGTEAGARADARVPLAAWVPAGEEFFVATVLADQNGAAGAALAYIPPDKRTVPLSKPRPATGDDATVTISWSLRFPRPLYFQAHNGPLVKVSHIEDEIQKVTIQGKPGIMRLWSPREPGQDMYASRLPTIILNWFDGPVLWSVQTYFLSPDDALRLAESIRPVSYQ